jgi:hypothetical protein
MVTTSGNVWDNFTPPRGGKTLMTSLVAHAKETAEQLMELTPKLITKLTAKEIAVEEVNRAVAVELARPFMEDFLASSNPDPSFTAELLMFRLKKIFEGESLGA